MRPMSPRIDASCQTEYSSVAYCAAVPATGRNSRGGVHRHVDTGWTRASGGGFSGCMSRAGHARGARARDGDQCANPGSPALALEERQHCLAARISGKCHPAAASVVTAVERFASLAPGSTERMRGAAPAPKRSRAYVVLGQGQFRRSPQETKGFDGPVDRAPSMCTDRESEYVASVKRKRWGRRSMQTTGPIRILGQTFSSFAVAARSARTGSAPAARSSPRLSSE